MDHASQNTIGAMTEIVMFSDAELDEQKIIHPGTESRPVLNAFRNLRTKLNRLAKNDNFVCLVTCVMSGSGSSFVATNLGAVIALDQSKTSLLVDCNLYEPKLHELFGDESAVGITDYLLDPGIGIEGIVYASGVQRMRVVPVGTIAEFGAEYFSSEKMAHLINALKSRYADRYVVVDAPPVHSAETRILVEMCDFVVLVVPAGKVTESQLSGAITSVPPDKLAGVVFND